MQTLHGYSRGHRLLARSGELDEREFALLDQLSDLSGYLPRAVEFDHYFSGFPCGRFYAFACTWLDVDAERGGTVLTHTLLIPREKLGECDDLFAFQHHFRRPVSADDREPYEAPIERLVEAAERRPVLEESRSRAAVALFFALDHSPLLWVEQTQPVDIVRFLWRLLWPAARLQTAFCTFALQDRFVEGRAFDFLGLPEQAQGAFHKSANSPSWCLNGQIIHSGTRALLDDELVKKLTRRGTEAVDDLLARARSLGLAPPSHRGKLRTLKRFLELEPVAGERLTAARARADLLSVLWPTLAASHEQWRRALDDLLRLQPSVDENSRALWELRHALQRPQARTLVEIDDEFRVSVEAMLEKMVSVWLRRDAVATLRELPDLLKVLWQAQQRRSVGAGVAQSLDRMESPDAITSRLCRLVVAVGTSRSFEVLAAPLVQVRHSLRNAAIQSALHELDEASSVAFCDWLAEFATSAKDLELLFLSEKARSGAVLAISKAVTLATELELPVAIVEGLLDELSDEQQLAWSLDAEDARYLQLALATGQRVLTRRRLDTRAAVALCSGKRNGAALLARYSISSLDDASQVARVLHKHGELNQQLFEILIEESEEISRVWQVAIVFALEPTRIWTEPTRIRLTRMHGRPKWRDYLSERLLRDVAHGELGAEDSTSWLQSPVFLDWLKRLQKRELNDVLSVEGGLANIAAAVVAGGHDRIPDALVRLTAIFVASASAAEFALAKDAIDRLQAMVSTHRGAGLLFAAELLYGMMEERIPPAPKSIVQIFPDFYRALLANDRLLGTTHWWDFWGWDRGRKWRHWLLDYWVEHTLPPRLLLNCIEGDLELAKSVFKRAAKSSAAHRQLLRELEPFIASSTRIRTSWERYRSTLP